MLLFRPGSSSPASSVLYATNQSHLCINLSLESQEGFLSLKTFFFKKFFSLKNCCLQTIYIELLNTVENTACLKVGGLRLVRVDKVSKSLREWGHVVALCLGHSLPSLKALPGSHREVRPLQLRLRSGLAGPHPGLAPPPGGICELHPCSLPC